MAPSTTDEQGESACTPSQGRLRRSVPREKAPRLPLSGPETITKYLSGLGKLMVAVDAAWPDTLPGATTLTLAPLESKISAEGANPPEVSGRAARNWYTSPPLAWMVYDAKVRGLVSTPSTMELQVSAEPPHPPPLSLVAET